MLSKLNLLHSRLLTQSDTVEQSETFFPIYPNNPSSALLLAEPIASDFIGDYGMSQMGNSGGLQYFSGYGDKKTDFGSSKSLARRVDSNLGA